VHAAARPASSILTGLATAIVVLTVSILPFLTPQWIAFEQGRANATAWTGYTTGQLRTATDAILSDLVFGPPDFDVEVDGEAVLAERERGHMRDVRTVFMGLWILAGASLVILVVARLRMERVVAWRAVRHGALSLAGAVTVIGVVAVVAFDALFELFHRIVFPGGSYTFDPASERLVQLFPFAFWQETAMVVGALIVVVALVVAAVAGRRTTHVGRMPAGELTTVPGTGRT
jgi:integral membrane protein (TIGR01906 family)